MSPGWPFPPCHPRRARDQGARNGSATAIAAHFKAAPFEPGSWLQWALAREVISMRPSHPLKLHLGPLSALAAGVPETFNCSTNVQRVI